MSEHARTNHAGGLPICKNWLLMQKHFIGIVQLELEQALAQRALSFLGEQGCATFESTRFFPVASKRQASLQRCVFDANIVSPVAVALFGAACVERMKARQLKPMGLAGRHHPFKHMQRKLGGDV